MKSWTSEPLLHFLLAGGLLFALAAWRTSRQAPEPAAAVDPASHIEVSAATIEGLRQQWQRQYQRTPTVDEVRGMVDDLVREQVLYREALALGLDRDDMIVRRRLAQKMEFLSTDVLEAAAPDEQQLQVYFEKNAAAYARPARVTFRHVYFSRDRRGDRIVPDVDAALAALGRGASDETLGDPFVGEFVFDNRSDREIAAALGSEFAELVVTLPVGQWSGPVASTYGVHLVRVDGRGDPQPVQLADVRDAVSRDFQEQRRRESNRAVVDRLLERYEVSIDEAAITTPAPELLKTARVTQ